MLVTPRGTTAAALYDFKDRVDPDEIMRKYRRAALLGISRQPIGINASSAIDRIPILIIDESKITVVPILEQSEAAATGCRSGTPTLRSRVLPT